MTGKIFCFGLKILFASRGNQHVENYSFSILIDVSVANPSNSSCCIYQLDGFGADTLITPLVARFHQSPIWLNLTLILFESASAHYQVLKYLI